MASSARTRSSVGGWVLSNRLKPRPDSGFWIAMAAREGDTFIVDVGNFNDRSWLDASGNFHSEAMTLVERYTMLDANTIRYEVTITDPKVFSKPWTVTIPLRRRTDIGAAPR